MDTFLTPRSSLTFLGSGSLLEYLSNNLVNSYEVTFQGGYNHLLTRKDSIALLYRFDGFRYLNISQSINSHTVDLSYARRVTGRLAFQVAAGPNVTFSRSPIATSPSSSNGSGSTGGTTSQDRQFFWNLYTTLTYQWRRTGLQLGYNHSVTGGSGVLAGSLTDNASLSATRQLTRRLNGALTGGYSRNEGVAVTPTSAVTGTTRHLTIGSAA